MYSHAAIETSKIMTLVLLLILPYLADVANALAIAPILSRGIANRPSGSRTSYGSSNTYRTGSRTGSNSYSNSYSSGGSYSGGSSSGGSYYNPPVQPAQPAAPQPIIYGTVRSAKMSLFYVQPAEFDPTYLLGLDFEEDTNATNMTANFTIATTDLLSSTGPAVQTTLVPRPRSMTDAPETTAVPLAETTAQNINTTTTAQANPNGTLIVYGNYYKHCLQSRGYGINPDDNYVIYGLAPPAPEGIPYPDFIAIDTLDDDRNGNYTESIRVFTDSCFFTIMNPNEQGGLRVTLSTSNCSLGQAANYQWPPGCWLSLYSGYKDTDWTGASSMLTVTSNDASMCRRDYTIEKPVVGIEMRWCQDPLAITERLNFTLTVVPMAPTIRTTPQTQPPRIDPTIATNKNFATNNKFSVLITSFAFMITCFCLLI